MDRVDIDTCVLPGDGYGDGYGSGSGDGYGSGYGYGSGDGYGSGSGDGYGSGYGDCSGDCSGSGYGSGYGYGDGYGSGSGDGYGSGIESLEGRKVYSVDGVPTVILAVKGDVAKAATINWNTELVPCYVAKVGGCFAHGESVEDALRDANRKYAMSLPPEHRAATFYDGHPDYDAEVPNQALFVLHGMLTGSCEHGRRMFCQRHGIDLDGSMTVREFCRLTASDYGGDVIRILQGMYEGRVTP